MQSSCILHSHCCRRSDPHHTNNTDTMKLLLSLSLISSAYAFAPPVVTTKGSSALYAQSTKLLDRTTGKSQLDPAVIARYQSLGYPEDTVLAEYVWVDAVGNTRSKTRTLAAKKVKLRQRSLVPISYYILLLSTGHQYRNPSQMEF